MKVTYALAVFPLTLGFGLVYYGIGLPVAAAVGTILVTRGIIKKVRWATYDSDILKTAPRWVHPILAFWTNRFSSIPTGRKSYLWRGKSELYRYVRWHMRNPLPDLGSVYLAIKVNTNEVIIDNEYIEVSLKNTIFPRYILHLGRLNLSIGWKRRGCFSISLKRR